MSEENNKPTNVNSGEETVTTVPTSEDTPSDELVSTTHAVPVVLETTSDVADAAPASQSQGLVWKPYAVAAVVILVMGAVLLFALEQQGRTNTAFFSSITKMFAGPAATVNGLPVSRVDFDRNFDQVLRDIEMQGFGGQLDPAMEASLREQAIQSLINAELLKQAADAGGIVISQEAVDARFAEIESGNGGPEQLTARMAEFGITMEQLRRDIERELAIQEHLNATLELDTLSVTDDELNETYEQILAANPDAEIPPLAEIRDMLSEQMLGEKQQQVVGEYIETLRATAEIVINV